MSRAKVIKLVLLVAIISVTTMGWGINPAIAREVLGKEVKTGIWRGEEIEYSDGEIIFQLNPSYTIEDIQDLLSVHNAIVTEDVDTLNTAKVEVPSAADLFQVIEAFNADPRIEIAEPNGLVTMDEYEYDYWFPLQWSLHNTGQTGPYGGTQDADIDAPQAWEIETGDGSVKVAILDSGIPYYFDEEYSVWYFDHPDLDVNKMSFKNWVDEPPTPCVDNSGHGTFIAGIISAKSNNDIGVMGLCWNCNLLIEKIVFGDQTWQDYVRNGILDAIKKGANVINISGGGFTYFDYLEDAVKLACDSNVVIAAVSGNQGLDDKIKYPARFATSGALLGHTNGYRNVIAVAATADNDMEAGYSNYGPRMVTVAAPGGYSTPENGGGPPYPDTTDPQSHIFSTVPSYINQWYNLYYGYGGGTSYATPHVAGLAALLMSYDHSLKDNAGTVRGIIEKSADKVHRGDPYDYIDGRCDKLGYGRINAFKALFRLKGHGNITTNVTWHHDIELNGNVIVDEGVTLTIDPGVNVQFAAGAQLIVNGALKAVGEHPDQRINFTSSSGNWGGIVFNPQSDGANSRIEYCNIHNAGNIEGTGTGIYLNGVSLLIKNNLIVNTSGDAIKLNESTGASIINNTIDNNSLSGINCVSSSPVIKNNIISNSGRYGIEADGGSSPNISYNDVYNNDWDNYFGCQAGTGDIPKDPLFRGGDPYSFKLQLCSPCIDAGDPSLNDSDGTRSDMGTFYYYQCPGFTKGDVNLDCGDPNILDVIAVVNMILRICEPTPDKSWDAADCNGDGDFNIVDAIGIVNVILGIGTCPPTGECTELAKVTISEVESGKFHVLVDNPMEVGGVELHFSHNSTLDSIQNTSRSSNLTLEYNDNFSNSLISVQYDTDEAVIDTGSGPILELTFSGEADLVLDDAVLCTPDGAEVPVTIEFQAELDTVNLFPTKDVSINGHFSCQTYNYGANDWIRTGQNSPLILYKYRSLIQFDLSALPSGATVEAALLHLYVSNNSQCLYDTELNVYRMKHGWLEGTGTGQHTGDGATWRTSDGSTDWEGGSGAAGSGDCEQTPIGGVIIAHLASAGQEVVISLDAGAVQEMLAGESFGNYGFQIRDSDENRDMYGFSSSESGDQSNWPRLEVIYSGGPPSENESPSIDIATPSAGGDTADDSYTITWTDSDPDDDATISLYYDSDNSGLDGTLIVGAGGISEDDETDSFVWDVSGLGEGSSWYVYAKIDDGINPSVYDYSNGMLTIDHAGCDAPATPTGLTGSTVCDSVDTTRCHPQISWDSVSGATSYRVYKSLNNGPYELLESTTATVYVDEGFRTGGSLDDVARYKVSAKNSCGESEMTSNHVWFRGYQWAVARLLAWTPAPEEYKLFQNYPNPFNPETEIRYEIPASVSSIHTTLKVYNLLGQDVRTLVDEFKQSGCYTAIWDGRDEYDRSVSSGAYFYRIKAGQFQEVKLMVLLK